ncbi:uncharacterized protein V6R79_004116 [Siganus canaliculatus]
MAPTERLIEWQTSEIVKYLLEDDADVQSRKLDACLEHDGPDTNDDEFDAVTIADKLKTIADAFNEDVKFRAALAELKNAVAQEAAEAAFSHGVEALCQTHVSQQAEVAPEMQLLKAATTFGLYVMKSSPELKNKARTAMTAFLNRRMKTWVTQQGGWKYKQSKHLLYLCMCYRYTANLLVQVQQAGVEADEKPLIPYNDIISVIIIVMVSANGEANNQSDHMCSSLFSMLTCHRAFFVHMTDGYQSVRD